VIHNCRAGGGVGLLERRYKGTNQWTDRATHLENKGEASMLELMWQCNRALIYS